MGEVEWETKRALRRLCCENSWSYGAVWRFDPRNSMLLTREHTFYGEYQVGQVIGNMLLQVHVVGEGAVGRAALTGKHLWIVADSKEGQEVDLEVLNHFSAGVKTLAVIPLKHHGVVLLGAMKTIMEKPELVDETRKFFFGVDHVSGTFLAGNVPSSSYSETPDMNSLFDSLLSYGNSCSENFSSINSEIGPEKLIRNTYCTSDQLQSLAFEKEEDLSYLLTDMSSEHRVRSSFTEGPCISSWSSESSVLTSLEPPMPSTTPTRDLSTVHLMKLNTSVDNFGIGHFQSFDETMVQHPKASSGLNRSFDELDSGNPTADVSSSSLIDDLTQWLAGSPEHNIAGPDGYLDCNIEQSILENTGNCSTSNVFNTEKGSFDGLGVDLGCVLDGSCLDFPVNSNITTRNTVLGYDQPFSAPRKGLFSELGIEELLEGVGSTITKSSNRDSVSASRIKGSEGSVMNGTDCCKHEEFIPRSHVGLWIDDSHGVIAGGSAVCPPKGADEQVKPTRKRGKPGESTRPRPKDRQLIQDRLKELRGIIPNGAKCSIDALLDRTVKHMLFLQNVSKYVNKIKQNDEPKLIVPENAMILKNECKRGGKEGSRDGITWAFEVGSQSMVCPIIVEDLSSPGQMMIEMHCEEQGLFLEIADVIRGFGLKILKGVMEVRNSKIWSHFIVEVCSYFPKVRIKALIRVSKSFHFSFA
ncbi:hypothetical protein SAY87_031237 [Trapa incisa]|uniref:BHLH domain-containing protein n=1 Tax=Trapa incisa TaxID=236973 RepID=A0AAN7QPC5_9MYRT|nr:hypothetical protein SAY87_031237 [Trapa incisa]